MDKCHICGNKNLLALKFPRNFKFIFSNSKPAKDNKIISFCNSCNLSVTIISEKFKKEINKNYINYLDNNDDHSDLKVFNKQSDGLNRTSLIINYLKNFVDLKKQNKVIDIGAGNGNLIYELSKYNQLNINAFDISSKNKNKLKNLNGFNNFYSDSIDTIKGEYDLVILSHVIEHIVSPKDFLEKIKKIIKKK